MTELIVSGMKANIPHTFCPILKLVNSAWYLAVQDRERLTDVTLTIHRMNFTPYIFLPEILSYVLQCARKLSSIGNVKTLTNITPRELGYKTKIFPTIFLLHLFLLYF